MNVGLYAGPVQLQFSSSNSLRESNEVEKNSIISNETSSINNETDEESERNGIDLNAIMNQRNLTNIVPVELGNLLYKLQPRHHLYHIFYHRQKSCNSNFFIFTCNE